MVFGIGQGAVVALALAYPRVVEAALSVSLVQPDEANELRPAWFAIRAVCAVRPATLKVSSWPLVEAAIPGLVQDALAGEPRPLRIILKSKHAHINFEDELARNMRIQRFEAMGDIVTAALLTRPMGRPDITTGLCPCGNKAILLALCPKCALELRALCDEAEASYPAIANILSLIHI